MWGIISTLCVGFVIWLISGFIMRRMRIRRFLRSIGIQTAERREVFSQMESIWERAENRTLGNSEIEKVALAVLRMTDDEVATILSKTVPGDVKFEIAERRLKEAS